VTALADALASPAALLTRLCVGSVSGRAAGAQALARMLAVNTRLRELHAGGVFYDESGWDGGANWDKPACDVLLAALPRASPALRLLTLPLTLRDEDDSDKEEEDEEEEGELGHDAQLRQLTLKALRREHPQCAEVRLTDAFRKFVI
jgi:hypothetical protein